MLKLTFPLFIILLLSSCSQARLTVQTKYFSHENLASYYVGTPDPLQNDPPIGQSLLMFWSLGDEFCRYSEIKLDYTIRLRNREEVKKSFFIKKSRGYHTFSLYNDEYFKTGGILTYKVDLVADGEVIEEWRQHLWRELILLHTEE